MAGLHTLKRVTKRASTCVGRGGKRGKTSGRGTKGQNARAGHKKRPEMRDIIKKLPKRRGYGKNRGRTVVPRVSSVALSLTRIDAWFETGAEVTPKTLAAKNIIARSLPPVKIVAGETTKKLTFKNCNVSATARAAIEKAGGTIA